MNLILDIQSIATFLLSTVAISLISTGVHMCTRDSFILAKPRAAYQTLFDRIFGVKTSEILSKPITECLICQSSFWSIILFWIFGIKFVYLPFLILSVCGLNTIITAKIKDILQ